MPRRSLASCCGLLSSENLVRETKTARVSLRPGPKKQSASAVPSNASSDVFFSSFISSVHHSNALIHELLFCFLSWFGGKRVEQEQDLIELFVLRLKAAVYTLL